eukprot:scaffold1053_cov332-Pavlova_lutheri.AAC.1
MGLEPDGDPRFGVEPPPMESPAGSCHPGAVRHVDGGSIPADPVVRVRSRWNDTVRAGADFSEGSDEGGGRG